jgi:tetratricopeptide (TPR) repeat protein
MEIDNQDHTINQAKKDFQNGNFKAAIKGFESALAAFQASGNELDAAEMANNLSVSLLQAKKKQRALDVVEGTDQIFARHNQPTKQAMAIGNRAAALEALKRFDEAEQAYQQSADLLQGAGEEELRGYVLQSLSALQLRRGQQLDGMINMLSGLEGQEKLPLRKRLLRWILKIPFKFSGK